MTWDPLPGSPRAAKRGRAIAGPLSWPSMAMETFKGPLVRPEGSGTWTYVAIPLKG